MEPLPEPTAVTQPERWSGLKLRIGSSVVAAALAIAAIYLGGFYFAAVILIAAVIMQREWANLVKDEGWPWKLAGALYILLPLLALLWLRLKIEENGYDGRILTFLLFCAVWATDIGAYIAGRSIGGPKICPPISPNKTWAGLGGGIIAAIITVSIFSFYAPFPMDLKMAAIVGALIAIVAQVGDFFESWLKRRAGVKDSGVLIPGHGGLLDRVDGLMFAAPVFTALVWWYLVHAS